MNRTTLLDILLVLAILWFIQGRWPLIPALFWRDKLKDFARACRHKLRHDRDILDAHRIKALEDAAASIEKAAADGLRGAAAESVISEHNQLLAGLFPVTRSRLSEGTETIVIAFALAFAVRSLVAQPFVIPTGSMQPTLNGVNVRSSQEALPATWRGHLDTLYYGRRYFEWIAKTDLKGEVELQNNPLMPPLNILSDRLQISIDKGAQTFQFPGIISDFNKNFGRNKDFNSHFQAHQGDLIHRGWQESGDRLFVDRISYNFREPRRGEITIFETAGLKTFDGSPIVGQFYVKRLIGLPGETLRINRDRRLEVKEVGSTSFRLIGSEKDGEALRKIATSSSGYHGWSCIDPESGLGLTLNVIDRSAGSSKPENRSLHFSSSRRRFSKQIDLTWDGKEYVNQSGVKAKLLANGQYEISHLDMTLHFRHSPEEGWVFVDLLRANGLHIAIGPNDSMEYTLPGDSYFLMGDNTDNSTDCRYFGCVPRKNLIGTALFVFWPFGEHFGPCGKR